MLTPDVKQQIADEVRKQLALENQEARKTHSSRMWTPLPVALRAC